jgi:sigma-E factor negative regulatory protein RseC
MLTESGVVKEVKGDRARVVIRRSTACQSCPSKSSTCACGALAGPGQFVVTARNEAQAKAGDAVELSLPAGAVVWASLSVYLLPVVLVVAGAAAAHAFRSTLNLSSDGAAGLGAAIGLAAGVILVWLIGRHARRKGSATPTITRVLSSHPKGTPFEPIRPEKPDETLTTEDTAEDPN